MAFVLGGQERAGAVQQLQLAEQDLSNFGKTRYSEDQPPIPRYFLIFFFTVYYRPYSLEGAIKSKTCFDESDIYLGRLNTFDVPPPHTIASLAASIASVEGLVVQDTPIIGEIQIFKDIASEVPMRTDAALSITEDAYLGHDQDDPVAVVCTPDRLPNPKITLGEQIA